MYQRRNGWSKERWRPPIRFSDFDRRLSFSRQFGPEKASKVPKDGSFASRSMSASQTVDLNVQLSCTDKDDHVVVRADGDWTVETFRHIVDFARALLQT